MSSYLVFAAWIAAGLFQLGCLLYVGYLVCAGVREYLDLLRQR